MLRALVYSTRLPVINNLCRGYKFSSASYLQTLKNYGFQYHKKLLPVVRPVLQDGQRAFHTSQRRDVPPLVWLIVKPIAKAISIISGRSLRKWWTQLPASEKQKVYAKLNLSQHKILAACGLLVAAGTINYVTHLQETPVTNRRRYIAFTHEQFEKIMKYELEIILERSKDAIVKPDHPFYKRVERVVTRLTKANEDLDFMQSQKWKIIVIKAPEQNAFVLPSGEIFVYTGLFDMITNDDQLAVVIGHEMSHALLNHGAERVSYAQLVDVLVILTMAAIWFFMPSDGLAIVTQWFYHRVVQLLLSLPYDRKLETEADVVGLQLMAKACYDVRESTHFWHLMSIKAEAATKDGDVQMPEWLSTHPSNDNRARNLQKLIPEAIDMRSICKCPPLNTKNPADGILFLKETMNNITAALKDA